MRLSPGHVCWSKFPSSQTGIWGGGLSHGEIWFTKGSARGSTPEERPLITASALCDSGMPWQWSQVPQGDISGSRMRMVRTRRAAVAIAKSRSVMATESVRLLPEGLPAEDWEAVKPYELLQLKGLNVLTEARRLWYLRAK